MVLRLDGGHWSDKDYVWYRLEKELLPVRYEDEVTCKDKNYEKIDEKVKAAVRGLGGGGLPQEQSYAVFNPSSPADGT